MIHYSKLKKKNVLIVFFLLLTTYNLLLPRSAGAVCPVCTIAVGAGLGISRALGIDDAVTSVWIGGLILSMSFWFIDWFQKKKSKLLTTNYQLLIIFAMYVLTLLPLWYGKYIGRLNNQIIGVDKILFGTAIGSLVFLLAKWADGKVRKVKGKQLFIYQKVVFPVVSLILSSVVLHFLIP